jgi:hypothetical protein
MNSNIHHIPQPSLAGHVNAGALSAKLINNAIANRDMRRAEAEWVWCPDGCQRRRDQLKWIVIKP